MSEGSFCTPPSRREARRESRRDAILEVAEHYFREHGYAGTTMSGIAAELGGSKGTLWNYFSCKELLFGAVLDRATAAFREELTVTLNPDGPVETALGRFCAQFLAKITAPESITLHRLVVGEAARFPEMGRIFYERAPWKTQELLAGYIAAVMEQGKLRKDDPLSAAQYLMALCMARSHQKLLAGVKQCLGQDEIKPEVSSALDIFLRAYR